MDVVCIGCGSNWDFMEVMDDVDRQFTRQGSSIMKCPVCVEQMPLLTEPQKDRIAQVKMLADLLGDDVDGFAAMLEDFGLDEEV